jgi:hypothetical protein
MTDTAGDKPPFPGFPGFPPAEMLDKMWDMMRLTPFGAAFPGMQPGTAQGFGSPLTAMSDMMSPLMSVEELDKRITDMRAVEQWLKLNLNMLQSAIQALEVQRATLSTLRAFGAFAQASMTQATDGGSAQPRSPSPWSTSSSTQSDSAAGPGSAARASAAQAASSAGDSDASAAGDAQQSADAPAGGAFDPSSWWNLLQSQFNQLAAFAMTQPGAAGEQGEGDAKPASSKKAGGAAGNRAAGGSTKAAPEPAAKRPAARKPAAKPASRPGSAARGEK